MRKKRIQKGQTAPNKLSYSYKEYFTNFIIFLLSLLIKIGKVVLWLLSSFWQVPIKSGRVQNLLKKRVDSGQARMTSIFTCKKRELRKKLERIKKGYTVILRAKREVFNIILTQLRWVRTIIRHISLIKKLKKKGIIYPPPTRLKIKYLLLGVLLTLVMVAWPITFYFWLKELPHPKLLDSRDIPATTKIYDRNGVLLYQIYRQENRTLVKLSDIPSYLKEATIAMEDKDFYKHKGVNWKGILRATLVNLTSKNNNGRPLQGGSSLTQQLIKSALLTSEPTLTRKIKEIVLALWAERIYKKDQILEMYFNQVPYGGTAWGIEAASETYFKKSVQDLNLAESALLAGLPAAPTLYSPLGSHPELAKQRQQEVLRRMAEDGYITQSKKEEAEREDLKFALPTVEIKTPHFVMYVKELLAKKYGLRTVEQGGLTVITSLDLTLYEMAQSQVSQEVERLKGFLVGNGAALVTNPQTGEILAMVGSRDYFDLENDGNVNVTLSLRQPGSAIKPVMYAAALQRGFTPASVLDDSPVVYKVSGQPAYSPVNYDGKFHGKITLRNALANSYNVPAVKVLNTIGVSTMIEMGRKMGITSWRDESRYGLSLTLGGGEVTMLDMATAYGVLATGGRRQNLTPILKVSDWRGNILEESNFFSGSQVVVPTDVAFQLSQILSDNQARIPAFGVNSFLNISGKTVAVKTGTTNDKRDNWTIGFTPSFLVAVWVGNNDNRPMHPYLTSGITGAAPIWQRVMTNLLKDKKDEPFKKGEEVIAVSVCAFNGLLSCSGCPTITEYFTRGTEPKVHCQITPTPSPTP